MLSRSASVARNYSKNWSKKVRDYTVFNKKACVSLKPISPEIGVSAKGYTYISKPGTLLWTFTPASESNMGSKFDWNNALHISTNIADSGTLISNIAKVESSSFYRNSQYGGTGGGGDEDKILSFNYSEIDSGKVWFVTATVKNKQSGEDRKISVMVPEGQMAAIAELVKFCIPRLVGFDKLLEQSNDKVASSPFQRGDEFGTTQNSPPFGSPGGGIGGGSGGGGWLDSLN